MTLMECLECDKSNQAPSTPKSGTRIHFYNISCLLGLSKPLPKNATIAAKVLPPTHARLEK